MRTPAVPTLLTPGKIADDLAVSVQRVLNVLTTRRHCARIKLPNGCLAAVGAGREKGQTTYVIYRNGQQLKCLFCGAARFRLRSAGRRQPCFACQGCGQRLEID